jgi:putative mRNA 3-end processing factor
MAHPAEWLQVTPTGLYCAPGGFYIDPARPVDRAVVTHGHGDHARPGHRHVLATAGTLAVMAVRYGADACGRTQPLAYGEALRVGEVLVRLVPAGHILGSAQVLLEHAGHRIVISGDYKRRPDPTCAPFEPVPCDVFITEATFGLPVFRHPPDAEEIGKLLASLRLFPERSHVVGVYALGKCQRVIALLRQGGYDAPIYLHGSLRELCDLYRAQGIDLGPLRPATASAKDELAGQIVLAPPSAIADRWGRRLADPVVAMASGWMRVRARARQRGVELPLVISDHADWDELTNTVRELAPQELWITHGRDDALARWADLNGLTARRLDLIGYDDDAE